LNDQDQITIPAGLPKGIAISAGKQHSVAIVAPRPAIVLTIIALPNSHFRLQFSSLPGLSYSVQASTNLTNWEPIGTATDSGNGLYQFEDAAGALRARYYRTAGF